MFIRSKVSERPEHRSTPRSRKAAVTGAVLAVSMLAAACGSDSDTPTATTGGGSATSAPSATSGPGTTTAGTTGGSAAPTTTVKKVDGIKGGTFRWGFHTGPDTADFVNIQPYKCTNGCASFFSAIFDPLVEVDPVTRKVVGVVAEKWEINPTATEFKFFLRKDVKFHDGTPLTSEDVQFSYDRICNAKELQPDSTYACSQIKALKTIEITTRTR